ncbi:MAG: sigma-70 family RNA polymerase sigma factor [Planctomycetota bacterium]|nr:sigma-70 family RNA polymerase sigma factor [Planctomycetota bacterium]
MDLGWLTALRAGDEGAWRRFLVEYQHVFLRAIGIGLWRLGPSPTVTERRALLVETMGRCYAALRGTLEGNQGEGSLGEGKFRAYLFHVVAGTLRDEQSTPSQRGSRSALRWQDDVESPSQERLSELRDGIVRLPPLDRSILIFYHLEPDAPSLQEISQVLERDHETVKVAYRRGLSFLAGLESGEQPPSAADLEAVEKWLSQPWLESEQAVGSRAPSRERIWKLASGELPETGRAELETQIAAHANALRELAVADCLLADCAPEESLQNRSEIADEVLRGAASSQGIRRFHWVVLAFAALIGLFMFFDDGQPVKVGVVDYVLHPARAGQGSAAVRECEFRLELACRFDRNVVLLLAHAVDGKSVISRVFPPSPATSELGASMTRPANPIRVTQGLRLPTASSPPFRYPWKEGMGVLVVSSDPAEVFSELVIEGLIGTAKILLDEGTLDPATHRRLVKGLTESAQHDSVDAHVHWIDLRAPMQ